MNNVDFSGFLKCYVCDFVFLKYGFNFHELLLFQVM